MSTKRSDTVTDANGDAVFERIHEIMFLFRSLLQQTLRDEGEEVGGIAMKVLGFFARKPGATQIELVQHSGRDKGQVARLVKMLSERGLLQREASAAGRRSGLTLTEPGLVLHRRLQRQRAQLANKLAATLSAKERSRLNQLLERLKASLLA